VERVAERAGLAIPNRRIPLAIARVLASIVEGSAKLVRAKKPPLINKARYKFLGLNLDFSIEKARRVLGYQPPFTFEQGMERAMAEHRPSDARQTAEAAAR
jgi:2-alkyl-3-oxoalkanoate reductase